MQGSPTSCTSGHSIETSVHEWPRSIPREHSTLQPDMVVLVEPGGYHPDVRGVRLQKMFLITETGHEVLSPFEIEDKMPVVPCGCDVWPVHTPAP